MRQRIVLAVFILATLGWGIAQQQPGMNQQPGMSQQTPGQPTQPGAQTPDASQSQPSTPGTAGQAPQTGSENGAQAQAPNKPITAGCLGGSSPNFTITDTAGKKYNLILPPNANASVLTPHVGEPVLVMGDVTAASAPGKESSINVLKIGKGQGSCAGSTAKPPTP